MPRDPALLCVISRTTQNKARRADPALVTDKKSTVNAIGRRIENAHTREMQISGCSQKNMSKQQDTRHLIPVRPASKKTARNRKKKKKPTNSGPGKAKQKQPLRTQGHTKEPLSECHPGRIKNPGACEEESQALPHTPIVIAHGSRIPPPRSERAVVIANGSKRPPPRCFPKEHGATNGVVIAHGTNRPPPRPPQPREEYFAPEATENIDGFYMQVQAILPYLQVGAVVTPYYIARQDYMR